MEAIGCGGGSDPSGLGAALEGVEDVGEALDAIGSIGGFGGGESEVCLMDPDGSGLVLLSDPGAMAQAPGFTYDGSMLYFFTEDAAFVADVDGANLREWDRGNTTSLPWNASPDGRWYTQQRREPGFRLYEAGDDYATEPGRRIIARYATCCSEQRWSPDSTSVLAYDTRSECHSLWRIDVMTLEEVPLTGPGSPSEDSGLCVLLDSARWSPDGSAILVSSYDVDEDSRIFLLDADGSNPRLLLDDGDVAVDPVYGVEGWFAGPAAWSPDGRAVIVTVGTPLTEFYVAWVDGSRIERVGPPSLSTAAVIGIAWAPG